MATFDVELRSPSSTFDVILSGGAPSTAGYIKYWNGSAWDLKPIKYWTGSAWVQKPVKFWNGSTWTLA